MKFYIVSLPSRGERRSKMKNRLESLNIDYKFIDAVTPDSLLVKQYGIGSDLNGYRIPYMKSINCTIGKEYACFASHLLCLKAIIDSGENGVIVEDDAIIHKDILKTLYSIDFTGIPLVMLYTEVICNEQLGKGLFDINGNWGAVGYWISLDYAKTAYSRYNRPFCELPMRTSEAITMHSGGKFILPQLLLEDPLNCSSLRDTDRNDLNKDYHRRFRKFLNFEDFTEYESPEYKELLQAYLLKIENKNYSVLCNRENSDCELKKMYDSLKITVFKDQKSLIESDFDYGLVMTDCLVHDNFFIDRINRFQSMTLGDALFFNKKYPETILGPKMYVKDPLHRDYSIKKFLSVDYSNYLKNSNPEYIKLLNYYLSVYKFNKKEIVNLDETKLNTVQLMWYYDLSICCAYYLDREIGVKCCKKIIKLFMENPELLTGRLDYFKNNMRYYFPSTGKSLLINANSCLDYNPDSIKTGIFGSEEAVIYMANLLSRNYSVTVVNCSLKDSAYSLPGNNPIYCREIPKSNFDIGISWRYYNSQLIYNCKKVYAWCHDICPAGSYSGYKGIFLLTNFHKNVYSRQVELFNPIVCGNGIVPEQFTGKRQCENKHSIVYTSCYDRGLIHLLRLWPKIKKRFPDATLDMAYGWNYQWIYNQVQKEDLRLEFEKVKHLGITEHGTIGHNELITLMKKSSIWAYPCDFLETFCITGVKMQAAGVVPVVVKIGALEETVNYGYSCSKLNEFEDLIFSALDNIDLWTDQKREEMANSTIEKWKWENVVDIWEKEFSK